MEPTTGLTLPSELEREIFEHCARSRPILVPKLMLVAWRVKEWVEPLLYRTIVISLAKPLDGYPMLTTRILSLAMKSKPSTFFRDSVRHLLLHSVPDGFTQKLLSICTRVENLWAPLASETLLGLASSVSLPLKHLYVNLAPLLLAVSATHPLFSQLTHLELIGVPLTDDMPVWSNTLSLLPRLTHLSFNEDGLIPICLHLLENCTLLKVLISLDGKQLGRAFLQYEDAFSADPRFVVMYSSWFKDWQMGVYAALDYWTRAEEFISKRRTGEVNAKQYFHGDRWFHSIKCSQ